ncbi:MAG: divergent polysaccharide deacetylase family protein [Proteobacteria bacterium]|nr:divergent polysaccharide deacetylase family protein [Pseudomonadota bacterium]
MRALIATWVVTLSLIAASALWLQLSYEPPVPLPTPQLAPKPENQTPESGTEIRLDIGPEAEATVPVPELPTESVPESTPKVNRGIEPATTRETAPDPAFEPPLRSVLPLASLSEPGPYGPLPIAFEDRRPWQVYGRAYVRDSNTPRIAIVLTHFGLGTRASADAISRLPADVTFAFSPYGRNLQSSVNDARATGHEILVMVPMEPRNYPASDPGPHTLLAAGPAEQNIDRLHFVLSRFQTFVGLVVEMGSKFTTEADAVRPIMADLGRRGILFLDTSPRRTSTTRGLAAEYGVLQTNSDIFIDNIPTTDEIDGYLEILEQFARRQGTAIGIGRLSYAVTVERVTAWAEHLSERGIELASLSAVMDRRNAN